MKIVGIGTDIVELKRLSKTSDLKRVSEFFFTKDELSDMKKSQNKVEFTGSRIALKEAVIKAFPGKLHYHDFVIYKKGEKIEVKFTDQKNKKYKVFASISHEFKYAIAYVIMTE